MNVLECRPFGVRRAAGGSPGSGLRGSWMSSIAARRWSERVIAKPRGFQLQPPKVSPGVPEAVQRALLDRKRLAIRYRQPAGDEPMDAEISVLGLVVRGAVTYLVTVFWDYQHPRLLTMHRILAADILATPSQEPAGFSFPDYVNSQQLDWPVGPPCTFVADVTTDLAVILEETRLSPTQVISPARNGWRRISAEVNDTMEFRAWVASLGDRCRNGQFKRARRSRSARA